LQRTMDLAGYLLPTAHHTLHYISLHAPLKTRVGTPLSRCSHDCHCSAAAATATQQRRTCRVGPMRAGRSGPVQPKPGMVSLRPLPRFVQNSHASPADAADLCTALCSGQACCRCGWGRRQVAAQRQLQLAHTCRCWSAFPLVEAAAIGGVGFDRGSGRSGAIR
jgi:hypothetical protein